MQDALENWLGKDTIFTRCISLKRATHRRKRFIEWTTHVELDCPFWDAVDYRDLTPQDLEKWCNVQICNGKFVLGASACRISITKCMIHFLNETTYPYLLLFEDDAGFVSNGSNTGCQSTPLSNKQSLLDFIKELTLFTHSNSWDMIWFGYYDGDKNAHTPISSLICKSMGVHSTHAMLFHRKEVQILLELLLDERYKSHPIDEFTCFRMKTQQNTLLPIQTIICQTDNEQFINYND